MALKPNDVRNMTADEIGHKVTALREEMFKLKLEQKTGRIEKPHRMRQVRKEIARCNTILREKETNVKE